jgi:hypothetical protein
LLLAAWSWVNVVNCPNSVGIEGIWLSFIHKLAIFFRLHTDEGKVVNRLKPIWRVVNSCNWPIESGSDDNWFLSKLSVCRLTRLPISLGTIVMELILTSTRVRLIQLKIFGKAVKPDDVLV